MKKIKFSNWPYYSKEEVNSVSKILLSGKVNYLYGKYGTIFENKFSKYINSKYAIAVSNGTVALELSLLSLNLKKNDEIIVTPRSYFSSASSILKVGAKPVFIDVDINTQNITLDNIAKAVTRKTKVIICVHLSGYPCDMIEISKFAKKNKLVIIEDCSQAHGAKINQKKVGSFGNISIWSFCNDKIISTGGEGGMITTNNEKIKEFIWSYKDQGKNYKKFFSQNKKNVFRYLHDQVGSNFRITEMQSIIGIHQLKSLEKNISIRNKYAKLLNKTLMNFPAVLTTKVKKNYLHAYYRYYFFINIKKLKKNWTRDKIIKNLCSYNIQSGSGSCPTIFLEDPFKKLVKDSKKNFLNAKKLGRISIALNIHHNLKLKEVHLICKILKNILKKASKKY
tara:strand:+ start:40020 stop:41201 length:1182 start_codon:yes stop_codon:yes gene_type:complete